MSAIVSALDNATFKGKDEKTKLVLNGVDFTDAEFNESTRFLFVIFNEDIKLGDNIIGSTCSKVVFHKDLDYKCENGKIIKK